MSRERLQKIVAQAGLSSRRGAEELITSGRVRVNGRVVTELGTQADSRNDRIEVDGKRLVAELFVYVLLHKPRKVVSTRHDPEGRPTVTELVATVPVNLYPVGRLDFHTSGALLLTNDGEFTQGMLHPRQGVPKVYVAKVQGEMDDNALERWRQGIKLEDGMTAPCEVSRLRYEGDKTWIEVTLHEGRNQQIRRMGEASGFPIMRLARLSFAGISTDGLRPGQFRMLDGDELRDLKERYGVPRRVHKQQVALDPSLANRRPSRHGGSGPGPSHAHVYDDGDDAPRASSRDDNRSGYDRDEAPAERTVAGPRTGNQPPWGQTAHRRPAALPEPERATGEGRPGPGRIPRRDPRADDRPRRDEPAGDPRFAGGERRTGRRDESRDERPTRTPRSATRPTRDRATSDRPGSDRRPADRTTSERRPVDRAAGERRPTDRPARERSTAERAPSDRRTAERASRDRSATDRPSDERPTRPTGDRSTGDQRSGGQRPGQPPAREPYTKDRPNRERPAREPYTKDRPNRERPARERPSSGPRGNDRPTGASSRGNDRPAGDRPTGGRRSSQGSVPGDQHRNDRRPDSPRPGTGPARRGR